MKSFECDCGCGARTTDRNNRIVKKENGAPAGTWVQFTVYFNPTADEHLEIEADAASFDHVAKAAEKVLDRAMRGEGRRPPKLTTVTRTVKDLVDNGEDAPLPLSTIPNYMGINLVAVEALSWVKREDGQLVSLTIHFIPEDREQHRASFGTDDPSKKSRA
jgi:hypothetical protein